jgi:hypothetical protein
MLASSFALHGVHPRQLVQKCKVLSGSISALLGVHHEVRGGAKLKDPLGVLPLYMGFIQDKREHPGVVKCRGLLRDGSALHGVHSRYFGKIIAFF